MSRLTFTPNYITIKNQRRRLAFLLVLFLTPLIFFNLSTFVSATETTIYDFSADPITIPVTASTSDNTVSDFQEGNSISNPSALTKFLSDGGIEINQGYVYNNLSGVILADATTRNFLLDDDLIYVGTDNGLHVINTQGTTNPADDVLLFRYHTGSVPALANNSIWFLSLEGDLLYIGTDNGLHVINTQGTTNPSDDVLLFRYHTGSVPALANNRIWHVFFDNNLLYLGTSGGLHVINTQGTLSPTDDTLVTRYRVGGTPALVNNTVWHSFVNGSLLYISTFNSLHVINTQGTLSPTDDTLVTRYHTGSVPSLADNNIFHSFYENSHLYVSSAAGGLHVINTQGTLSPTDDTLVTRYHTGSVPSLDNNYVISSFINNNLLYINTNNGLHVINTQGTLSPTDDTLVTRYNTESTPAATNSWIYKSSLDDNFIYMATRAGLNILSRNGTYLPYGMYVSSPRSVSSSPTTTLRANANILSTQDVTLSYRVGTTSAVWQDEFDTLDNFAGDYFDYGGDYDWQSIVATSGVLQLSGKPTVQPSYAYFVIDTGLPDNYFDPGSIVSMRYRVLDQPTDQMDISICTDNYEHCTYEQIINSEWNTVNVLGYDSLSRITIDLYTYFDSGFDLADSVLEIDYIRVTTPDSMGHWGSWNTCTDISRCTLGNLGNNAWLQYRLELETDDTRTSPVVTEVIFEGPHQPSYTYTSETTTFSTQRRLTSFTPSATIPASTTISYQYSTDGGVTFTPFDPYTFEDLELNTASFTWRAVLSTTDFVHTPTIAKITLSHTSPPSNSTGTSLQTQLEQMERSGEYQPFIQNLREQHPAVFNGTASPAEVRYVQIILLREAAFRMDQLFTLWLEENNSE